MLYYEAPSDEIFNEVREACAVVWKEVSDYPSYLEEKLTKIDIDNVRDNFMYLVALFDVDNQRRLFSLLSEEAKTAIIDRMRAGGAEEWTISMLI